MDRIADLVEEMEWFASKFKEEHPLIFPYFCCDSVASNLYDLYGYFFVIGGYVGSLDKRYLKVSERWGIPNVSGKKGITHTINYDTDLGVYIDLTASQFDRSLPEILIMGKDDPRVAVLNGVVTAPSVIYCVSDMGTLERTIEDTGNGKREFISAPPYLKPEYLRR